MIEDGRPPLRDVQVHLVDSVDMAACFLAWLGERRPEAVAIDTETRGLGWHATPPPGQSFLRLVQFGDSMQGWSIPADRWLGVAEQALAGLSASGAATSWWNVKFDFHALASSGLTLPRWATAFDGGTAHRLLHPMHNHMLKHAGHLNYGHDAVAGEELRAGVFKEMGWDWDTVPVDHPAYWAYGAIDTVLTARLTHDMTQDPALPAAAFEREMAVQAILYRAEERGVKVDPDYAAQLRDAWRTEAAMLREHLEAQGIQNPASNKQVSEALEEAGWEPDEFTPTGMPLLDKQVLAVLSTRFPGVAEPLLRFRRLTKWTSTYLDTFLTQRDANDCVHPSINTAAARTGRMSVTSPPFQTLPSGDHYIRTAILPAREGEVLWAVDYANMEYRAFGTYANDPALIRAFAEGVDIHALAAEMVGIERKQGKMWNFARLYGAGARGLAQRAQVPEQTVKVFFSKMDELFPGAAQFMRSVERTAKERASIEGEAYIVTGGGRRLPTESDKVYRLTNYLIQGTCADVLKDAIIRVDAAGLGDAIVMPVHDELLFSFPEGEGAALAVQAAELMEDHSFTIPLTTEITGPLRTWGDAYRKDEA